MGLCVAHLASKAEGREGQTSLMADYDAFEQINGNTFITVASDTHTHTHGIPVRTMSVQRGPRSRVRRCFPLHLWPTHLGSWETRDTSVGVCSIVNASLVAGFQSMEDG